jgi:hypothetical protein
MNGIATQSREAGKKIGVKEYWGVGVLGLKRITPLLHHSITRALVHRLAADGGNRDMGHR